MHEPLKKSAIRPRLPATGHHPAPHRQSIQAHGLLLVLSQPDLVIRQVSQNSAAIIGKAPEALLGRPVEAALGRAQKATLEQTLQAAQGLIPERILRFNINIQGERRQFNAYAHRRDGQLLLELEPARVLPEAELSRVLNQVTAALAAIECEFDMLRLSELATRAVREITRADRTLFYRLDENGNGEVIAEARSTQTSLPRLLGKLVAGDNRMAQPAPPLRSRRLREVRDLRGRVTFLMPPLNPVTGTELSLRHAFLRAQSDSSWKKELAEDGVRGKMRIIIHAEGRAWGLLISHHERPASQPRELRRVCQDLAQAVSRQVGLIQNREAGEHRSKLAAAREKLLAGMALSSLGFPQSLSQFQKELLAATAAGGAALWWSGRLMLLGRTPPEARVLSLARWLGDERPYVPMGETRLPAFATRSLEESQPQMAQFRGISGVIAVPFGATGCLMWFRKARPPEIVVDLRGPEDALARPLRSAPWTSAEIASAQGFIQFGWVAYEAHENERQAGGDEHLGSVIENLAHGVVIYSEDGRPLLANSAAARIYGLPMERLLRALAGADAGQACVHLRADGSALPDAETPMRSATVTGEPVSDFRMGILQRDDSVRWTTVTCRPVTDSRGRRRVVVSLHDVSEQQRIERDLQLLAHFDPLTSLPNRALLKERIDQAIERAREAGEAGGHVGIIIVGLDRFKEINDSLGNAAGDQVLQEVARRLDGLLGEAHTVARFGGDEFAVLVEAADRDEVAATATRCREALDAPAHVEGNEIFIGCSIGVSLFPDDGHSRDDLLTNADIAMNEAKAEGGNNVRLFSRELQVRSSQELSIAAKLRRALDRGELHIAYQPQVSLKSNQVQGVEALMRWDSPELGIVPPAQFIRIAEETGLILPMGEWLLTTACEDLRAWQAAGLPPLTVAVNLSARQFRDRQLAPKVAAALSAAGMDARWLEFEITENVIMQDTQHNIETLEQLVSLGCKVAIDDFGTGYSSLAYLKRFPVHMLKIDRAFVRDISTDRDDAAIVKTIVALAHALELGVIAEGVETEDQLRFLAQLNCDLYQGYYFSRPVPADEIVKLLKG